MSEKVGLVLETCLSVFISISFSLLEVLVSAFSLVSNSQLVSVMKE